MKLNTKLFLLVIILTIVVLFSYKLNWGSNTFIDTVMDISSLFMIAGIAFLQFIYFLTFRTRGSLLLSAIFLGTAMLEGYHAIISSPFFIDYFQLSGNRAINWSWFATRFYMAGALVYFVFDLKDRDALADKGTMLVVGTSLFCALAFLLFVTLPVTNTSFGLIAQPQELIPGALFIAAIIGIIRRIEQEESVFERWLIYFLLLSVVNQILIAPMSTHAYDTPFNMAHIFKILSYTCLLIGIGFDIAARFLQQKQAATDLANDTHNAMEELQALAQAARDGNLSKRIATQRFDGNWRTIMEGTNTILDETQRPMHALIKALQEMEQGKLTTRIEENYKGDHNHIKIAINSVAKVAAQSLRELDKLNAAFTRGDYSYRVQAKSFTGDWLKLMEIVNHILATVHQTNQAIQAQNWVKSGLTTLSKELRSDMDMYNLTGVSVSFLARYTEAQAAAIYTLNDNMLCLSGQFALQLKDEIPSSFALGEGLIGQVAMERKELTIKQAPANFSRIISATGEMHPCQIIILPLLHEGELKGVLELSRLLPFDALALEFLHAAADTLASLLCTVEINQHTRDLLAQSQRQAEQLQTQQEILKQNNEELEQQTQALRVSEEELRTQQEELQQINEDLEMRAQCMEVLTTDLREQNMALEQAQVDLAQRAEDLELASKYKGEFLANMSHELRTPLNSMLLLSRSLADNRDGNLTAKQIQAAKVMHQSGKDLLGIINDILDLSKIEAGREVMVMGEVNLTELSSHLALLYEQQAIDKKLQFNVNVDESLSKLFTSDRQRLGQILRNLLTNAFKFTTQGGVTLDIKPAGPEVRYQISSPLHDYTGPVLALAVTDSGIGIPFEKQKHIWEAFQQADGSTSREYGGTGLGLTISRELAKLLGGEIQLNSEPGKGSTFTLLIPFNPIAPLAASNTAPYNQPVTINPVPAATPAPPTTVVEKPAAPQPVAPPAPAFNITDDRSNLDANESVMLIVEKDPDFAETLTRLCRENKTKFLLATNADEAREAINQHNILGVFLDMLLPDRGGWDVLSYLKENAKYMHIPVFVTSPDQEARRALNMGAAGFLQKPFSPDQFGQLFARVNEINDKTTKNLLLVEDDHSLRLAVHDLLKAQDVSIIEASNGKDSLARIAQGDIDLIILDLGLPDMDGFSVLDQAQALPNVKLPPVIIFTGRELSREEYDRLQNYAANVIVKGDRSDERLVDEAALFLHRRVADLPDHARKMLASIHDREGMFVNKQVLLVDDDIRNIFALVGLLESRELKVITAKNGQDALEQLAENPHVDMILTDIMMPVMDGYEFIRNVRNQPKHIRLPIIALTAKAMKEDRERCLEAGASDYLSKPIDPDRLFSMMRVWMYR